MEIFPDVAGVLRVLLVQAPDLAGMDTNLIGANTSDPYVVFSVDDKKPTFKVSLYPGKNMVTSQT